MLTIDERAVIEFLLAEPFLGRDELRQQLDAVQVVAEPGGGASSLGLSVERAAVPTPPEALMVPVEAEGRDQDGMPILVALHAPDGFLRELEIVRFDGEPPYSMPTPASLTRAIQPELSSTP